jgi:hypothetical protein
MKKLMVLSLALVVGLTFMAPTVEAKSKKKKKKVVPKIERTVSAGYLVPVGAAEQGGYVTAAGNNVGGVAFTPAPGEAYVSVTITDTAGQPVSGMIAQDTNGDNLTDTSAGFCGATTEPVPIDPAYNVVVYVFEGPCSDTTPAVATTGTVTATFSNLP